MTDLEIREQAEKILQEYKGDSCYIHEDDAIGAMNDLVKWMQEQDKWISVETPPMKPNGVSELYVLASEDEDCLTVEKVFYDTKDNTYWIPFCSEPYFPKWYCYLPSPPKD